MKLSFYARGDLLVTVPGQAHARGQHLRRVGRTRTNEAVPPATKEPFEADSESDIGRRLIQLATREACLWAADKETAQAIGVPFVELDFVNNSWVPKASKPSAVPSKGAE